jgi:hypothetical protein
MKSKIPRVALTKDELRISLDRNIRLLIGFCRQYDDGDLDVAIYIAVALRVLLCHSEHGNSKSLLEHLGLRSGQYFYTNAAPFNPKNLAVTSSLTAAFISSTGAQTVPILADSNLALRKLKFSEWWTETIIKDARGNTMSRFDLVSHVANTEGAHVDSSLVEAYMDLTRNNSLGFGFSTMTTSGVLPPPHLASMRQIAHELIITLEKNLTGGLPIPYTPITMAEHAEADEKRYIASGMNGNQGVA